MEITILKRAVGSFFVAVLFFAFSANLQANYLNPGDSANVKTAVELTKSLSAKVSLTEKQVIEIQNILVEYQKELITIEKAEKSETISSATTEIDNNTNKKIVALLDENQKTTFDTFKSEWWKQVRSKVHPMEEKDKEIKKESKEKSY